MKKWTKNAGPRRPKASVVMAVYKKLRELELCLEGYRRQSALAADSSAFELILADDGSGPEIEAAFERFAETVSFPCTYLWQEDRGWGKLRMLNWATHAGLADRMVFTDGDCVPHRRFVEAHIDHSDPAAGYCGRRVDLMEKLGPAVTLDDVRSGRLEDRLWLAKRILGGDIEYGGQAFYLPGSLAGLAQRFSTSPRPSILGSNFGIHKKWLEAVNGFDESFGSPGLGEDTDLERRLRMAGADLRWITYRAIQFHLWHPLTRVREPARRTWEERQKQGNLEAVQGLREFRKTLSG